ncbi:major facilitator superfamily domain-containing protein [Hyaloraphidium curvatum]|nr:major facilitator superfamily domain-containing protein [Hyaloraphidium curvatum]
MATPSPPSAALEIPATAPEMTPSLSLTRVPSPSGAVDADSDDGSRTASVADDSSGTDPAPKAAADAPAAPPPKKQLFISNTPGTFMYRLARSPSFAVFVVTAAVAVDLLVYSIIIPLLPFIFERLGYDISGKSSTLVGILVALFGVGTLVASPIYGVISDRYKNRKWPMIAGLGVQLVAIVMFMLANSLALLYFARFLQGVAAASIWTVGLAFISDLFPAHELGRAMSTVFLGLNIGMLIGPVVGGIMFEKLGYYSPFILNCVVIVADMVLRLMVAEPDHTVDRADKVGFGTVNKAEAKEMAEAADKAAKGEPVEVSAEAPVRTIRRTNLNWTVLRTENPTFWQLWLDPCVMLMNWLCIIAGIGMGTIEAVIPLFLSGDPFNANSLVIGLVFLAMVVPNCVSAIVSGWLRDMYGSKWILYLGLAASAVAAPMLALPSTYWGICIALFVYGWVTAAAVTPALPELTLLVPENAAAKVFSIFNIFFAVGIVVGPLIGGALYSSGSFPSLPGGGALMGPMLLVAAFNLISLPLMWVYFYLKEERDEVERIVKWEAARAREAKAEA